MRTEGPSRRGEKAICLSSGGKDSILALHFAKQAGFEVEAILTMLPQDPESPLYHVPNVRYAERIADCIGVRWLGVPAASHGEEAALQDALANIDAAVLVTGGVASTYQGTRFERIAESVGLSLYSPLWGRSANWIYSSILKLHMDVLIVAVAAYGLTEKWLGAHLDAATVRELLRAAAKYRFDPVGEGGDLDTFVLDAPLYQKRLVVSKASKTWLGDRGMLVLEGIDSVPKPSTVPEPVSPAHRNT